MTGNRELDGRAVIVTGGARGLGAAICSELGPARCFSSPIGTSAFTKPCARCDQPNAYALVGDIGDERDAFLLDRFPDLDPAQLQDPGDGARAVRCP